MRKVVLLSVIIPLVLLSFVSASFFNGAWGKITGNAIVSKSDVLQSCVRGCLENSCVDKDSFQKKVCQSRVRNSCVSNCKNPVKVVDVKVNKQVSKVRDLKNSDCIGNVCKLYEGDSLIVGKNHFSIGALSNEGVILSVDGDLTSNIGKQQTFSFNDDLLKIVLVELSAANYNSGEKNFVIFSIHRKNTPKVAPLQNKTLLVNLSK